MEVIASRSLVSWGYFTYLGDENTKSTYLHIGVKGHLVTKYQQDIPVDLPFPWDGYFSSK